MLLLVWWWWIAFGLLLQRTRPRSSGNVGEGKLKRLVAREGLNENYLCSCGCCWCWCWCCCCRLLLLLLGWPRRQEENKKLRGFDAQATQYCFIEGKRSQKSAHTDSKAKNRKCLGCVRVRQRQNLNRNASASVLRTHPSHHPPSLTLTRALPYTLLTATGRLPSHPPRLGDGENTSRIAIANAGASTHPHHHHYAPPTFLLACAPGSQETRDTGDDDDRWQTPPSTVAPPFVNALR